jgi:hypothetical protein
MIWLKAAIIFATVAVAGLVLWISVKPMINMTHTVSYYIDHPLERATEIALGNNDPSKRGPDYQAAVEAKWKADADAFLAAVHKGN